MSRLRTDEDGNMIFRVAHGGSREQSRHKHENQATSGARLGDKDETRSMRGEIALRTRASLDSSSMAMLHGRKARLPGAC